jgi:hypothetical protein
MGGALRSSSMPIFELFTKREKKRQQSGQPDVYQYDDFPQAFRVQVVHIWMSLSQSIKRDRRINAQFYNVDFVNVFWAEIHTTIAREVGLFNLQNDYAPPFEQCSNYLLSTDKDGVLNTIDVVFHRIAMIEEYFDQYNSYPPQLAIEELNCRFREHGIGYQFEGQLVRVDSQYTHSEVTKPALSLLQQKGFEGPLEEFLRAHGHYRKGRATESIADSLKAFESTMKTICDRRKWAYDSQRATAKDLIKILFDNGLVPGYLDQQFTNLRVVLESGLPTVRNKTSGHGQGSTPIVVPDYLAQYALHLVAANIVFLAEANKAKT